MPLVLTPPSHSFAFCQEKSWHCTWKPWQKGNFGFHCQIIFQNACISPKYLAILKDRHLFCMLANFFGEWSDLKGRSACVDGSVGGSQQPFIYYMYTRSSHSMRVSIQIETRIHIQSNRQVNIILMIYFNKI